MFYLHLGGWSSQTDQISHLAEKCQQAAEPKFGFRLLHLVQLMEASKQICPIRAKTKLMESEPDKQSLCGKRQDNAKKIELKPNDCSIACPGPLSYCHSFLFHVRLSVVGHFHVLWVVGSSSSVVSSIGQKRWGSRCDGRCCQVAG